MNRILLTVLGIFTVFQSFSQHYNQINADRWVDSVFKTLSPEEKIAQLMVVRVSAITGPNRQITFYEKEVSDAITQYNIGGLVLFQGGPVQQAIMVNNFQALARTPLLVTIDGENGVGMRFDSVQGLPRQMMLGAVQDASILYRYGSVVGDQCRRSGIHVNYAPVVDVNNNPDNPVINDRSFGEDKFKVALFGIQYMKGMQDRGVMACAKHFPGHGDVNVDSHYDLPVIRKSRTQLDSLELYPFRQIVNAGVGSVMVAHLFIPSIDNAANRATSLSPKTIKGLLRQDLKFNGLTFTDALEMRGVTKFYPAGEASAQSLVAGNDMLCLPGDIPGSIEKIKEAIQKKRLTWGEIDSRVKKVLHAKFKLGLANREAISLDNITEDLNREVPEMRRLVAEHALTVLRSNDPGIFPLPAGRRVAYVGIGAQSDNSFAEELRKDYKAHTYYFDYQLDSSKVAPLLQLFRGRYDVVIIGVHGYSRFPANNFGVSESAMSLVRQLQQQHRTVTMAFGNPYLLEKFCNSPVLIACYEDDSITQKTAVDLLAGRFSAKGKLPVTVCEELKYGTGLVTARALPAIRPADAGFNAQKLSRIDSIVNDAIAQKAIPGAVVLIARDGKIIHERAYGHTTYDSSEAVYAETIYDLASVTKVMATTVSVMKLYEEGRLDLDKTLGDYLPILSGTNKAGLKIRDVLLHQAGLKSWIPFYRETVDAKLSPNFSIYARRQDTLFNIRVAENLYMRRDWVDTMYRRMIQSDLSKLGNYVYSDMDFIFLGNIVEALSGKSLDEYTQENFYQPLGMSSTGFRPRNRFTLSRIAPTEREAGFRQQLIAGDVHDPGAAMFGGIAGHAGLFSTAYDLALLSQVLLNGGNFRGQQFFRKETIDLFTAYHGTSRRGLGWDKPEKDNAVRKEPYPTLSSSPMTFGHTGFTGTCLWIDPVEKITFIFLSNRVHNNGDPNRFLKMSVRPKVHETIYQALR